MKTKKDVIIENSLILLGTAIGVILFHAVLFFVK